MVSLLKCMYQGNVLYICSENSLKKKKEIRWYEGLGDIAFFIFYFL